MDRQHARDGCSPHVPHPARVDCQKEIRATLLGSSGNDAATDGRSDKGAGPPYHGLKNRLCGIKPRISEPRRACAEVLPVFVVPFSLTWLKKNRSCGTMLPRNVRDAKP